MNRMRVEKSIIRWKVDFIAHWDVEWVFVENLMNSGRALWKRTYIDEALIEAVDE